MAISTEFGRHWQQDIKPDGIVVLKAPSIDVDLNLTQATGIDGSRVIKALGLVPISLYVEGIPVEVTGSVKPNFGRPEDGGTDRILTFELKQGEAVGFFVKGDPKYLSIAYIVA